MVKNFFVIVYAERSGSHFLAKELTNNYDVYVPPETNFIPLLIKSGITVVSEQNIGQCITVIFNERKFLEWKLHPQKLTEYLSKRLPMELDQCILHVLEYYRITSEFTFSRIGIKKGSYLNHIEPINALFPDTKYVGIIRDPRAILVSMKQSVKSTGEPFEKDPVKLTQKWLYRIRIMRDIEKKYNKICIIKYEDMIRDLPEVLEKIAAFLEVDGIDKRNAYRLSDLALINQQSTLQKPLEYKIDEWKTILTKDEIEEVEEVAFEIMQKEGYKTFF